MSRHAPWLALALLLLVARGGQTEGEGWERLTITLMPQYDDPRLLILYEPILDAPGEVAIAIPPNVELASAAYWGADGRLVESPARFEARSGGRTLIVDSAGRAVRVQFYQDVIPRRSERVVDFTLPPQPVDVGALVWEVIFPLDAREMATTPLLTQVGANHLGMPTFRREAGPLAAGSPAELRLEWWRESDAPSLVLPESPTPGRPWRLYGVAAALFLAGLALVASGARKRRAVERQARVS